MRVIRLGYIRFPVLPVGLGHPQASGRGSQDQKLLFWGNRHGGARTGTVPEAKQKLRRRRAPQEPRSSAETTARTGYGPETVATWLVPAAEHANAKSSSPCPTAWNRRHHSE
jgi:hypothetical protein